MGMRLNRKAYETMIAEDIARVEKEMVHSPERMHIIDILRCSPDREYGSQPASEVQRGVLEAAKALLNTPYGTLADCDEMDAAMHALDHAITKAEREEPKP